MKKQWIAFILVIGLAALYGCRANEKNDKPIDLWVVGDCYKVDPDSGKLFNSFIKSDYKKKNFIWDSDSSIVSLFGARNEYVAFQIIIDANKDLSEVDILTTDFKGSSIIANDNIDVFSSNT